MPLVFVHCVSVRRNGDYDKLVSRRDSLFRRFALKQLVPDWETFDIKNPYWGMVRRNFAGATHRCRKGMKRSLVVLTARWR
jgi:hypothetical protein